MFFIWGFVFSLVVFDIFGVLSMEFFNQKFCKEKIIIVKFLLGIISLFYYFKLFFML